MKRAPIVTAVVSGWLVSGCAMLPRHAGFPTVATTIEQRTGLQLRQYPGAPSPEVAQTIHELLQDDLTLDRALQIAILNNRGLQATFDELGVARAEVVQVSLLKNPIFSGHARVPREAGVTNLELALAQSVIDTLFLPLRRRIALAQFEQATLRVTDEVLNLLSEVKTAYYAAQTAEQVHSLRQTTVDAAHTAAELATRQYAAGNIRDLDLANEDAAFQQAQIELARSVADQTAARERLNQFLGLSGAEASAWHAAAQPLELPFADPSHEALETLALTQRLDLAIIRQETVVLRRSLSIAHLKVVPDAAVAIDSERDPNGSRVTGPVWDAPIPIFDWGQADQARLNAQLRQGTHQLAAMEVAARAEVRTAYERMVAQRQIAQRYRDQLIPLRQQIVASSLRHYNYMLLGAPQLLMAKQNEITTEKEYLEALRDYWITRAQLERAVGGRLPADEALPAPPASAPEPPISPSAPPAPHQEHHHGGPS